MYKLNVFIKKYYPYFILCRIGLIKNNTIRWKSLMTNEEFRAWINGFLTLSESTSLNKHQITIIKNHANLVLAIEKELDLDVVAFLEKIDSGKYNFHELFFEIIT